MKNFISITDLTAEEILQLIQVAIRLKTEPSYLQKNSSAMQYKNLVMLFEKPSLRTRLSFEIGMNKLGGQTVSLSQTDIALGTREPIEDIAKVITSMGDILVARTCRHTTIESLAASASIPVINGLSDIEHPCQTLADLMTIFEMKKDLRSSRIVFLGDGENNVVHSLCLAMALLGGTFICASPKGYWMNGRIVDKAKMIARSTGAVIQQTDDTQKAVSFADVIYTDTWISMGDEAERETRLQTFRPYQVNIHLMKRAKPDAIFMHDMPAYRGHEVTADVIDGIQSVIYQQA